MLVYINLSFSVILLSSYRLIPIYYSIFYLLASFILCHSDSLGRELLEIAFHKADDVSLNSIDNWLKAGRNSFESQRCYATKVAFENSISQFRLDALEKLAEPTRRLIPQYDYY